MLGDIDDPQPVRGIDPELPVDQVRTGLRFRVAHRAAVASTPVEALDARLAHQPGNPLEVHRQTQSEHEFGVYPRRAVGPARLLVNPSNLLEQQFVLMTSRRVQSRSPLVIARPRHIQYPASHRDIEVVGGEFMDQRED
jgi:hypothetical protein